MAISSKPIGRFEAFLMGNVTGIYIGLGIAIAVMVYVR